MKLAPLVLLALLAATTQAQDTTPLVKTTTRVILLDVIVTDKAGTPIRTLTQEDFTILEDGKPQKISSFEQPLSADSSVAPNTPRTIILLDELNVGFADRAAARDTILLFLAKNSLDKLPTALMTLNLNGLSMLQDYTLDAKQLKDRLTRFRPALLNPVEGEYQKDKVQEHAQKSINSLLDIARAAQGSSYNLNVVWVTGGFAGTIQDTRSSDGRQNGLRRLANLLMRARIRLYSIDPGGVKPLAATVVATPAGNKLSGGVIDGQRDNDDLALAGSAFEANDLLDRLTRMTGGRAYFGRNDTDIALAQAIHDASANYSISYSPVNSDFSGEYRKIEIRTNVEGASARTRRGYYAIADEPPPSQEMREARWSAALASPLQYSAFDLSCPLTYTAATNHASGTLKVKPTELSMQTEPRTREIIRAAALSASGSILTSWSWQIDWKKSWTNRVTTASFDKLLPKKTQRLRFLASDADSMRIGTCDSPLP